MLNEQIARLRERVAKCTEDYLRIGFLQITGAEAVAAINLIDKQQAEIVAKDKLIKELQDKITELGWQINPDRMG